MSRADELADRLEATYDHNNTNEAATELRRLSAVNAELLGALERIADPRNIHFAGDAQIVARAAIQKAEEA